MKYVAAKLMATDSIDATFRDILIIHWICNCLSMDQRESEFMYTTNNGRYIVR